MKTPVVVIFCIAFLAGAAAAQQAAPVFHNLKIGVPLSQQHWKFCTTRMDGTISIIDGENLTPCFGFSGYHDDTNRSTQLPVLLGGYPELEASDHRDSTLTIIFPNDSETIGDATVEGVTIEMAAGNPQGVVSGIKQKWGPPSSCHTTPMRTGIGIPIERLSCSWKLRWGSIFFESLEDEDINKMQVWAESNRLIHLLSQTVKGGANPF